MRQILDTLAPHLPMLSVTALPTVLLGGVSLLLRPRGGVVASHRTTTRGAVPVSTVLDRLDHERETGELPVYWFAASEQWLAEDWQRAEVPA